MGIIKPPQKVKVFAAIMSGVENIFADVAKELTSNLGPVEFVSPVYMWTHTRYYEDEMGPNLKKVFYFFKNMVDPDLLPDIKIFTNQVEEFFSRQLQGSGIKRPVNIDPGYITMSRVVLASTKDYSHRIYLGKGIYGEVTLFFKKGSYRPFPYTYPDYRSEEYIKLFNMAREKLFYLQKSNAS